MKIDCKKKAPKKQNHEHEENPFFNTIFQLVVSITDLGTTKETKEIKIYRHTHTYINSTIFLKSEINILQRFTWEKYN